MKAHPAIPETRIVGIDCATQSRSVGVAVGRTTNDGLLLERVRAGDGDFVERLVEALEGVERAIIAIDAPLGWPRPLGDSLRVHEAGQALRPAPNDMFRRETDRFIKREINQQPLDVGADRIARTAHAALSILDELRAGTGERIPLAWDPGFSERFAAIEVYPAATLRARGIRCQGYKKAGHRTERKEIIQCMEHHMELCDEEHLMSNDDALDAAICVLAARDFLSGRCLEPGDPETVRREGWIWCVDPE